MKFESWVFNPKSWVLSLESWILNLEFWSLNLESWVLSLESWILKFESWILNLESWVLSLESWVLSLESWVLKLWIFRRKRRVWHVQYSDWSEQGIPKDLNSYIQFMEEMSSLRSLSVGCTYNFNPGGGAVKMYSINYGRRGWI